MSGTSIAHPLFLTKKGKPVEMPMPLAPLADTHGHLTSFRTMDATQAIARAALAGVRLLVVPVDPADDVPDAEAFASWFRQTIAQAAELVEHALAHGHAAPTPPGEEDLPPLTQNVHFVAGVHPYGAQRLLEDKTIRNRLRALLDDPLCVGMGEFGLDYGPWNELEPEVQMRAFRAQLRMAYELNLPVELHLRDANNDAHAQAHQDALRVLREEGVPPAGCDLHCFTSDPQVMEPFTALGCHIAFGGAATFARSNEIRAAAAACPSHLLLSETDSPYMAPVPLRGRECEPAMVAFSVARVAQLREEVRGIPAKSTYEDLWSNACRFFGLG